MKDQFRPRVGPSCEHFLSKLTKRSNSTKRRSVERQPWIGDSFSSTVPRTSNRDNPARRNSRHRSVTEYSPVVDRPDTVVKSSTANFLRADIQSINLERKHASTRNEKSVEKNHIVRVGNGIVCLRHVCTGACRRSRHSGRRACDGHADQAPHHHRWRESQLQSPVRHLRAKARG